MISLLESKNWLHKVNDEYKPSVFIADPSDAELLYQYAQPISKKIAQSIAEHSQSVKQQFLKTEISKKDNFQKWSFLILSNVLLDSWQIGDVEKEFLKQDDRPLRHGNHYYYQMIENADATTESFGIYGNQYQEAGDAYICIYGNHRLDANLTTTENSISKTDNVIFEEMAKNYLPQLTKILESKRKYSQKIYVKLGYSKEITFEEFFIWWYHFIYTQATNEMNKKGILLIPESGNFDYYIAE